jgi:hypothetical protein
MAKEKKEKRKRRKKKKAEENFTSGLTYDILEHMFIRFPFFLTRRSWGGWVRTCHILGLGKQTFFDIYSFAQADRYFFNIITGPFGLLHPKKKKKKKNLTLVPCCNLR